MKCVDLYALGEKDGRREMGELVFSFYTVYAVNLLSEPHSGADGGGNAPITLDANRR